MMDEEDVLFEEISMNRKGAKSGPASQKEKHSKRCKHCSLGVRKQPYEYFY